MSKEEDQLDTRGAITDIVFDDNHHERRSWRFCNPRIPRSEVFYFTQNFVIIFNFSHNSFSSKTCVFPA